MSNIIHQLKIAEQRPRTYQYMDKSGKMLTVFLDEDGCVEARTRAGKTLFAAYLSRFATNNGYLVINLCKNLKSQSADWELKHVWLNKKGEELFFDEEGRAHKFITESFSKSKTFQRDLENPGRLTIYHGLKNPLTITSLYEALSDCRVKHKSVILIVDEAHHAFHQTNRKTPVKGNIKLADIINNFRDILTVISLSASANTVRDLPIWKHHYFLNSKKSYDPLYDTKQFYISLEEWGALRYTTDNPTAHVSPKVNEFIVRQGKRPGVCLLIGQSRTEWHAQMTDYILDTVEDAKVIVVNSGKYRVSSSSGQVELLKNEKNKNIGSVIEAVTKVFADTPESKIFVVGHNMIIEGESFRNAAGSTCLTGLLYCPSQNAIDEGAAQAIGRIELEIADELGWKVEVCSTEEHFVAVVEYSRDSLQKALEKSEGKEYSEPHYMNSRLTSSMKNKAPANIVAKEEKSLVEDLEDRKAPYYKLPTNIDVDEIFGRPKGRGGGRNARKIFKYLRDHVEDLDASAEELKSMKAAYPEIDRYSYIEAPANESSTFIVNKGDNTVYIITPEWRKSKNNS
jgi:hypothetical protein